MHIIKTTYIEMLFKSSLYLFFQTTLTIFSAEVIKLWFLKKLCLVNFTLYFTEVCLCERFNRGFRLDSGLKLTSLRSTWLLKPFLASNRKFSMKGLFVHIVAIEGHQEVWSNNNGAVEATNVTNQCHERVHLPFNLPFIFT